MESLKPPVHILEASKRFAFTGDNFEIFSIQRDMSSYILDNELGDYRNYQNEFNLMHIKSCYPDFRVSSAFAFYIKTSYNYGMIEGYLTILDFWKGKRQSMRAGKFIKRLFPFATDPQVECIVAELKDLFAPLDFELVVCGKAETFNEVYMTPHIPKQSPSFDNRQGYCVKRLDSSCMRWEYFSGWEQHPAAVYGAGDLQLAYVKDRASGKIGARVIIYPENLSCSNIYSSNDKATELLVNYLKENKYKPRGISGARLSKVRISGSFYLMPYIDDENYIEEFGDHFIVGGGRIPCDSTAGRISIEETFPCDYCGENYPESQTDYIHDSCLCFSCIAENYVYSELMGEYIWYDECETNGNGESATGEYFSQNGHVLDYEGIWQNVSECVEYGGQYYHHNSVYVVLFCDKYYHEDSEELREAKVENEAYRVIVTYQLGWETTTRMSPFFAMLETKERVLRDNYQLNENGIPERLPEFQFDLVEISPEIACV